MQDESTVRMLLRDIGFKAGFRLQPVVQVTSWKTSALLVEMFSVIANLVFGRLLGSHHCRFKVFHLGQGLCCQLQRAATLEGRVPW